MKSTKLQKTTSNEEITQEPGITIKIGRTILSLNWDSRQWIYRFGKSGPFYLTNIESVYNYLVDDTIKLKKSALDIDALSKTLSDAKKDMQKILDLVGKELDNKRTSHNQKEI